jgi:HTH-type transcriptional regulator/antitoxin HigA
MPAIAEQPKMRGYMALLDRFPLKTIEDDVEREKAVEVLQDLMGRRLDKGEGDYLDVLIALVNLYEHENHAIDENMTPREALTALMRANALSQAEMGKIIGSESAVSMFLRGERELSKSHIKKLAERFKVDAALFM